MYLCYIDESGTPDVPGNTSHYVLAGVSIPVQYWRDCDKDIEAIKADYALSDEEIHVAWMLRSYPEQNKIVGFDRMDYAQRRHEVTAFRTAELLRLQRARNPGLLHQTKKNYEKTACYVHLAYAERRELIRRMARTVSCWGFARLFAECVNKLHFDPARMGKTIDEQAFEQIVSRFETFLQATGQSNSQPNFGLLIHDNNETVAKKHTQLMKKFHRSGTLWVNVQNIIETPLFVNSQLTSMVQMADLCAYALRRYLENQEEELFDLIFTRADRRGNKVVGVRHFTRPACACKICATHRGFGISVVETRSVPPSQILIFADLTLNLGTHEVYRGARRIELTAREFELLALFMQYPPRQVITRDVIHDRIWGHESIDESNTIAVYIRYLRSKLEEGGEPRLIQTVRGFGYALRSIDE